MDRVNGGTNAGRICWAVAGTLGVDEPDNQPGRDCALCDFHREVIREELPDVMESPQAVGRLGYSNVAVLANGLPKEDSRQVSDPVQEPPITADATELQPNCWEYMRCGLRPGVDATDGLSCSAPTETRLDGIHGGVNGGRACWALAGTTCNGSEQDAFAQKRECTSCSFYKVVVQQQLQQGTGALIYTTQLRRLLRQDD